MKAIKIKRGEEKLEIPTGIFVNGYIIKAPMRPKQKSMIELNNRVNTHVHTDHKEN